MIVLRMFEKFDLGTLESHRRGSHGIVMQLLIKLGDQLGRSLVIKEPQRSQGAPCPCLDRHTGQTERGSVIPRSGLAGAQGDEGQRLFSKTKHAHVLLQPVHRQLAVIGKQKVSLLSLWNCP